MSLKAGGAASGAIAAVGTAANTAAADASNASTSTTTATATAADNTAGAKTNVGLCVSDARVQYVCCICAAVAQAVQAANDASAATIASLSTQLKAALDVRFCSVSGFRRRMSTLVDAIQTMRFLSAEC